MSTREAKIPQMGEDALAQTQGTEHELKPELPAGATLYQGEDDKRCRLIKADGTRCRGTRMRDTGLCPGHSGVGRVATDPAGASKQATIERQRRAAARMTLGVSARRAAQPLTLARIRAQERAEEAARALIDAPLDDAELGTIPRQQAVIRAMELLYPQVHATVEAELPADEHGVAGLDWSQLQALASQYE